MVNRRGKQSLVRQGTKQSLLVAMLGSPDGASIQEIVGETGWRPNSVHAALSTLRKQGLHVHRSQQARYKLNSPLHT
jgi:DNA-binding IclR family transcriptional regulator